MKNKLLILAILILVLVIIILVWWFFPQGSVVEISEKIPSTKGDVNIVIENNILKHGEVLRATFFSPSRKDIYVIKGGCEPQVNNWQIQKKNLLNEWEDMNWNTNTCFSICDNNKIIQEDFCASMGMCLPAGCGKVLKEKEANFTFEWNQKIAEYKDGICDGQQGRFLFISPAPPGEYKLRFEYSEDMECETNIINERICKCKIPKFAEMIFAIKN